MNRQSLYFKVCPDCGKHGRIVFSTGITSNNILYKEQGIEIAKQARQNGLLTQFEFGLVCEQIKKSNLYNLESISNLILSKISEFELAEKNAEKNGCEIFYGRFLN